MDPFRLYAVIYIIPVVLSQITIDISGWNYVSDGSVGCETEQIGGWDSAASTVQLFGGNNSRDVYVFDPDTATFTNDADALSSGIVEGIGATYAQATKGDYTDTIYYLNDTADSIIAVSLSSRSQTIFATLNVSAYPPSSKTRSVCVDDVTGTVYVAGDRIIETCTESNVCSATLSNDLADYDQTACEYYDGNVYVFGGKNEGGSFDTVLRCDPIHGSCAHIANLTMGSRHGIRSLKISCSFQSAGEAGSIALIGGADGSGDPSGVVEVLDIATGTVTAVESLQQPRDRFVAVWDTESERVFVFGGLSDRTGACVESSEFVEVTSAAQGVCQTMTPTANPTMVPTSASPTVQPSMQPSEGPTSSPVTSAPSKKPTSDTTEEETTPEG